MIEKLNEILNGIDKDICQDKSGWWETSCGAEFGAKKLKEVQELVKKLTLTDVVKSFSAEQVVNELKDCETLDDAIMYFSEIK